MNNSPTPYDVQEFEDALVIVDTSALLATTQEDFLSRLAGATVVIPAVVITELEGLRSSGTVGYFARHWLNTIESLRCGNPEQLETGVAYSGVVIRVQMNNTDDTVLPSRLRNGSPDSTILAVAGNMATTAREEDRVVLISNDLPMRLYATLLMKLEAASLVARTSSDNTTWSGRVLLALSETEASSLNSVVALGQISFDDEEYIRELISEQTDAKHVLAEIELESGEKIADLLVTPDSMTYAQRTEKGRGLWVAPRTVEQKVATEYLRAPADAVPFVSVGGRAGTGKTFLSVAVGIQEALNGHYANVSVFRSLHEMGRGQEMGFLPGDVNDKMGPWKGAIEDAIEAMRNESSALPPDETLKKLLNVSPITYLRGRSLARSYVILEEAQNFSRSEILNVMSRLGEGSKLVLTFDDAQVDNRYLQSSARADVWSVVNRMASEELFAHITLYKTERSPAAELASRVLQEG